MNKRVFKDELTDTWFKLGIAFGIVSLLLVPLFYIFEKFLTSGGINCAVFALLHVYCPGCGGTRSFNHLVHLRIFKSFLCNPFVTYTYIDYLVFMVNTILVKTTKKLGFTGFPVTMTIYAGIAVLFGQWIIRNILYLVFHITCI